MTPMLFPGRATRAKLKALDRSQAVIEFKPDGTIVWANRNVLAVFGHERADVPAGPREIDDIMQESENVAGRTNLPALAATLRGLDGEAESLSPHRPERRRPAGRTGFDAGMDRVA